jgi:hypothetical protein
VIGGIGGTLARERPSGPAMLMTAIEVRSHSRKASMPVTFAMERWPWTARFGITIEILTNEIERDNQQPGHPPICEQ